MAAGDLLRGHDEIRIAALDDLGHLDRRTGSEYTPTLRAYVRSGGSIKETSKALGLHANSVRYRMTRITEITGLELAEPDRMLAAALHLFATADHALGGDHASRTTSRLAPELPG